MALTKKLIYLDKGDIMPPTQYIDGETCTPSKLLQLFAVALSPFGANKTHVFVLSPLSPLKKHPGLVIVNVTKRSRAWRLGKQ